MTDASFTEGHESPLNIGALDAEDLKVISTLTQDAVFPITEMRWQPRKRRFALLLNRFRWEDPGRGRHAPERVRSLLVFDNVLGVASQGIDRADTDLILSLLSVEWQPGEDAAGQILLTLAGDGALRLRAEALEARLRDVTRPYVAPSKRAPEHPE
ncbi:DUF2948 family protein [Marimonas arenosa]|uniref:DUF2948 family protein n=1 Tax=Marimonas arenosa TaxID=1795305 RepID=A0AAE4B4E6_9RHOB|nr:DUF2948 family protein [Marimonas arenosa]MDQ2090142.1 DUF2948 family protein [Marimonas arenosa]